MSDEALAIQAAAAPILRAALVFLVLAMSQVALAAPAWAAAAARGSSLGGALGGAADTPVFAPPAIGVPGFLSPLLSHPTGHRAPPPLGGASYLVGRRLGIERHSYPSTYDLRTLNRVTPVRDQGYYGTCWAFAAIGSLESNLARDGVTQWDFSEDNVAWFSGFNMHGDPYDDGGYSFMVLAYLARWDGPVLESDDPYADGVHPTGLTVRKHLQEAVFVPPRSSATDNDAIKAAVMAYGGVDASIYMDESTAYWKDATDSYYYTGSEESNHDVVIVGWNDGYAASKFPSAPPGNGAFIVKNSWGTSWGASGYFYVSYYDTIFARDFCSMAFDLAEGPSNYTGVYQYDPLGFWPDAGPYGNSTGWFANVFTATSNDPVDAVAFYTPLANCSYQVSVGSSIAAAQLNKSGTIATPGYHTVVLDTPVPVTSGQPFSVVVKLAVPGGSYHYPIPVEVPIADYSDGATANPGESFISWNGTTWQDLTSISGYSEANVCLKAFTSGCALTGSMSLDGGAAYTTTTAVTIASSVPGATLMRFRGTGGSWSSSEPYGAAKSWTLPNGDGATTVEAEYRDASGNLLCLSDDILLDTTAPVTTDNTDGLWHRSFVLKLTASDATSGVATTEYRIDGGPWQMGTRCLLRRALRHLRGGLTNGPHTVEFYSTDAAGKTETIVSRTVLLDYRAPVTSDDAPPDPQTSDVTVHLTADDALSGVAHTYYWLDEGPWVEGSEVVVPAPTDGSGNGVHTIWYYSTDTAGNAERWHLCTVTIDVP